MTLAISGPWIGIVVVDEEFDVGAWNVDASNDATPDFFSSLSRRRAFVLI